MEAQAAVSAEEHSGLDTSRIGGTSGAGGVSGTAFDLGHLTWEQKAELVVGPRAQARYLNLSLPVSVLLGLAASTEASAEAKGGEFFSVGPVRAYAQLTQPGLRELRGWAWAAELKDAWAGLFRAEVQRPWGLGSGGRWSLEHTRTHGAVPLPWPLLRASTAIADTLAQLWDAPGPLATVVSAVVPITRLRAASSGGSAGLGLRSADAPLGGAGWGGSLEASRQGWGAQVHLAGGDGEGDWGRPQYTVTAQGLWRQALQLAHEFRWMFSDGQGAWLTVRPSETGPRVNLGLEIR